MEIKKEDWDKSRKIDRYLIYQLLEEITNDEDFGKEVRNHIKVQLE